MEVVILAGGKGTRLHPFTLTLPKPLMPVGDRPILEVVIARLKRFGVDRITIAVNHMADLIMAFFGNGEKFGVSIRYSMEDQPLGTVGPLCNVTDLPENFFVMNGDVLTNIDFRSLFEHHCASGCELTIATYRREAKIDFGVLDLDRERITGFREKPLFHFDVSMGIYVFRRSILDRVPANQSYGIDNLVLAMLKSGIPINAYRFDGYWLDIGRPDDYDQANRDITKLLESENL